MMKKVFVLLILIVSSLFVKAQSAFSAQDIENYLLLSPDQLITSLSSRGFRLSDKQDLPNRETHYLFDSNHDHNKRFLAFYYGDILGIIYFATYKQEQDYFKSTLKNDGFVYKETGSQNGFPSVKYIKDGGGGNNGLELQLGVLLNGNKKLYDVFFWNWRKSNKPVKTELTKLNGTYEIMDISVLNKFTLTNGEGSLHLFGQTFIDFKIKKESENKYNLFLTGLAESNAMTEKEIAGYSKTKPIATISIVNNVLSFNWIGLENRMTHKIECANIDGTDIEEIRSGRHPLQKTSN